MEWLVTTKRISVDTCADPCPCRGSTTGRPPTLSRTPNRSSMPNFACPAGRRSFVVSYRWSNPPIVQQQLIRRKRCGKCTRVSCDRGRSILVHTNRLNRWQPFHILRMPNSFIGKKPFSAIITHEETGSSLDHTNLTIGHGNQSFVNQFITKWIPGLS